MMRKIFFLAALVGLQGAAFGASVLVNNVNEFSNSNAIVDNTGVPIASGSGYVAIGYFNVADVTLATTQQLVTSFVQYGGSTTFGAGLNVAGLFNLNTSGVDLSVTNPFSGKALYVLAANGNGLNTSDAVFIWRPTGATFGSTEPVDLAYNVQVGQGAVVRGGVGNYSVDFGEGNVPAFNMVLIPEPSVAMLGIFGGLVLLRRRRV